MQLRSENQVSSCGVSLNDTKRWNHKTFLGRYLSARVGLFGISEQCFVRLLNDVQKSSKNTL